MIIKLASPFLRAARALSDAERAAVFGAILELPGTLGDPHRHGGAGLRKLHASGVFEVRAGLKLRLVFGLRGGEATVDFVGTHDEVQRYLRRL